ncbi:NADH:flavin oxidoreductase NADH oxidase family protein [Emericellopsis atlantica]|uniref:NADH:flavin oxidoreductase NADH oxidase family protein n=1 Tax=Emericellopsis atlantica TaxID=2614577 RepID=A0A9P7ZXT9_9HYPO|nr:NADH:flavin oxidoreductase NADH oxidase family protein [Emericellopsis atlantica]KAG9259232.1 NADH:flavin oxidoreductase NADH oxidase family protein [Emericellopsis atlantica]
MGSQISPAESKLFKPLKVGNCELQHRIALAPLTRYRNGDGDHVPLPLMEKYYADRGSVPGTLVISEATAIAHSEEGQHNSPGFVSDAQVEGWRKIIKGVHDNGSFYFQQIWAMGRAVDPNYVQSRGYDYRSSSNVPMKHIGVEPRAMTEEEILQVIDDFVATAKRVVSAGGDGVEIHSAHGYLLDQFLTEGVNKRTDKWGGSIENRARLTLEVVRAVTAAVGAEKVGIRFSPWAGFQGSEKGDVEPLYTYIIDELKRMDVNLAYISLVEARGDPGELILGTEAINKGKTLDFILENWNNKSPVMVAGAYRPETAAQALETRYAQWDTMVAFGRYFISNPDLVYRIKHDIPLAPYNRDTFYLNKQWTGYNDQPFSDEFAKAHPDVANKYPTPADVQ